MDASDHANGSASRGDVEDDRVLTIEALERIIGKTPAPAQLKVIDHLDPGALRWLAASPVAFVNFADAAGPQVTIAGGGAGFASGSRNELSLPASALDAPGLAMPGRSFASLFLLPGVGETLRINGIVSNVDGDVVRIRVDECFGHCAKSLLRAELWKAVPLETPSVERDRFLTASRFLVLATVDADGRADLSPKGDPAGRTVIARDGLLWFADRKGNRRVDSFRNILTQPRIALVAVVPGSSTLATVRGVATMTTNAGIRDRFVVDGKLPQLAVEVSVEDIAIVESGALERAAIWPAVLGPHGIDATKVAIEHIRLNRSRGFGAKFTSAVIAGLDATGLVQKVVDKEYKDNLY